MTRTAAVVGALLVAALLGAGTGGAARSDNPKLTATVGPGFTISLKTAAGTAVTKLDPGTYDIEVSDQSEFHSFHLRGSGVDKTTSAEEVGSQTWTVTFQVGTYTFFCNEHPSSLTSSFTVGTPTSSGGTTPAISAKTKLVLKVGPGFTITLKTTAGKSFKAMKRGTYTILVRDLSSIHNAHLTAPGGVSKKTRVAFVGKVTWKVKLAKVGTLKFKCDPHASSLHGSKKIV
jgi:plastocyanin